MPITRDASGVEKSLLTGEGIPAMISRVPVWESAR
jgi:hypothetical protein